MQKKLNRELSKGDLIKCESKQDLLIIDLKLTKAGYKTDYVFKHNGEDGLWIEIKESK